MGGGVSDSQQEAATVARILVEQVICRYGTPIAALSDRGKEVDGRLLNEVCRLLGIDKMRTTAYKPSTNAQVERMHATLNSLMAKTASTSQSDWDIQLPYIMAAYRASRHSATGMTPNFLMLGREVRSMSCTGFQSLRIQIHTISGATRNLCWGVLMFPSPPIPLEVGPKSS